MHRTLNVMVIVTHVGVQQSDFIPRDVSYQGQCLINPLKAVFLILPANGPNTFDTRCGKSNETSKKASYAMQGNHISLPGAIYDVFKPYGRVLFIGGVAFQASIRIYQVSLQCNLRYHSLYHSRLGFFII